MKQPEAPKSVGIWIRVPTEDQAHGDSPEHHERRTQMYAEVKGWKVREVYHLEAASGKSVMGHPETKRIMEQVRAGHITGLIFSKLARLARNTRELLDFADYFQEHDADLISLHRSHRHQFPGQPAFLHDDRRHGPVGTGGDRRPGRRFRRRAGQAGQVPGGRPRPS